MGEHSAFFHNCGRNMTFPSKGQLNPWEVNFKGNAFKMNCAQRLSSSPDKPSRTQTVPTASSGSRNSTRKESRPWDCSRRIAKICPLRERVSLCYQRCWSRSLGFDIPHNLASATSAQQAKQSYKWQWKEEIRYLFNMDTFGGTTK